MGLQIEILKKIKQELSDDPMGIGYAGKTPNEKLALLNNAAVKERVVYDTFPSPVNRILSGLADLPNSITLAELVAALATT